jgi:hypothetical protein
MVSLAGLSGVAGGYEDIQKDQMEQALQMMRMRQMQQDMGPIDPRVSQAYGLGGGGGLYPPTAGGAPQVSPAGAPSGSSDPRGLVPYIRQEAVKYGIDPDVAVRVATSEGLRSPTGDRGTSFGAMQLHTGGGLGDVFRRQTGLDPADPKNEKATIDFALQNAARGGWGPWHGAQHVGIGQFQGISGRPPMGPQVASAGPGLPAGAIPRMGPGAGPGMGGMPPGGAPGGQQQINPPGTPPTGEITAPQLPVQQAQAGQPPAPGATPSGVPPRGQGMRAPEDVARRLLAIPGITMKQFTKYMSDYMQVYGGEERAKMAQEHLDLAQQKLDTEKKEFEERQKRMAETAAATETGRKERFAAGIKARAEAAEKKADAATVTAQKKEDDRRQDVKQAQQFKRDEQERAEQLKEKYNTYKVDQTKMPPEALDNYAKMVLDGNFKAAMSGAGTGAAGTAQRNAIMARAFELGKEQGLSVEDINNKILEFGGRQAGISAIARNEAKITTAASQVDAANKVLEGALSDSETAGLLPTTRFKTINAFLNASRDQLGDPRLAALQAALNDNKTALARLYSGGNAVTVAGREEAEKNFNRDMNPEAIRAVMEISKQTSKTDVEAVRKGRESYTKKIAEPSLADLAAERSEDPVQQELNRAIAEGASTSQMKSVLVAAGKKEDEAAGMLSTALKAKEFAQKQAAAKTKDVQTPADLVEAIRKGAAQPTAQQQAFNPMAGGPAMMKGVGRMFTVPGELRKAMGQAGGFASPTYGGTIP